MVEFILKTIYYKTHAKVHPDKYCLCFLTGMMNMKEINEEYFIMWLSRVHGMDNNIMDRLIEYFGSAKGVYNASIGDLYDVCGMKTA